MKIVTSIDFIADIDTRVFLTNIRNGEILYYKYQ